MDFLLLYRLRYTSWVNHDGGLIEFGFYCAERGVGSVLFLERNWIRDTACVVPAQGRKANMLRRGLGFFVIHSSPTAGLA